ncbi:hypothetical protein [Kineococcus glutinatus]|uniref:hypothetical protein n=1 Tax=Kineococcus glutinatus TaxID=1070872 RepID=UPI0031EBE2F0
MSDAGWWGVAAVGGVWTLLCLGVGIMARRRFSQLKARTDDISAEIQQLSRRTASAQEDLRIIKVDLERTHGHLDQPEDRPHRGEEQW